MLRMVLVTASAVLLASAANAAIVVTTSPTAVLGQTLVETFDAPAADGFTFSPLTPGTSMTSGTFSGSSGGVDAAPAGDTTTYFAALGAPGTNSTPGVLTSSSPLTALSVEIGSLDSYNSIAFYSGTTLVESLSGTEISPTLANTSTTAYYDFTDTSGTFDTVVFSSSPHNALEIDNISVSPAPEPSAWALMFAGVAMIGAGLRRRGRFSLRTA